MQNIQKRYILSSLLAGLIFLILYGMLDFYWYVALPLTALSYVAGIFLFKNKDMRIYDPKAISRYYFEMSRLNDYKDRVKDDIISNRLGKIVSVSTQIVKHLETKPRNATKIYNFLDYYLPFSTKIIIKYLEAESKEAKTFVENKLILKMSVYIKEVEFELEGLLQEIVKSKDKELDFEMKVFEKTSDISDVEALPDLEKEKGSEKDA